MQPAIQTIALIAHDGKKADMVAFTIQHRELLEEFNLVGTGTTGKLLQDRTGLSIKRFMSGPLGGDVQIAERVVTGGVQAVVFFVDPLDKHPHDPDIQTLMRACNVHNVPLATNMATARFILNSHHLETTKTSASPEEQG